MELNSVGFIPECPPPFGPAFAPGALLLSFREGVSQAEAEALVGQLPPQVEVFAPLSQRLGLGLLVVEVPPGWEGLFLGQYLRRSEVLSGRIVPSPPGAASRSGKRYEQAKAQIEEGE